jgi:hypothetical protein|tara:strand:+ start:130 stop:342 length:213 start_codon:yes stop_codon:yes gene_type:complete
MGISKKMQLEAAEIESIRLEREENARFDAINYRSAAEKRLAEEGPSDSEIEDMEIERLIELQEDKLAGVP